MENSKLGPIEGVALVVIIMTTHILLNLPVSIIKSSGSAAILNILYVIVLVFLLGYLLIKLFKSFNNYDIIDISEFLGGKFLKVLLGILIMIYMIFVSSILIRSFSESLKLIYLLETPVIYVVLVFIIMLILANRFGFKTIVKCNLILMPLILISILVIFFASSKYFDISRIFPIFGYGVKETFLTGAGNIFAFGGIIILLFIIPLLKRREDFRKITFLSISISAAYLFMSVSSLALLFSYISNIETPLPIYLVTQNLELSRFFQRSDAIFMLIWILSTFSYLSIVSYFVLYIFKKITNIKNHGSMSYCLGAIMFSVALIPTNLAQVKLLESTVYKYSAVIIVYTICILILILANIKYKFINRKKVKS